MRYRVFGHRRRLRENVHARLGQRKLRDFWLRQMKRLKSIGRSKRLRSPSRVLRRSSRDTWNPRLIRVERMGIGRCCGGWHIRDTLSKDNWSKHWWRWWQRANPTVASWSACTGVHLTVLITVSAYGVSSTLVTALSTLCYQRFWQGNYWSKSK